MVGDSSTMVHQVTIGLRPAPNVLDSLFDVLVMAICLSGISDRTGRAVLFAPVPRGPLFQTGPPP